jgi:hypothetical protein
MLLELMIPLLFPKETVTNQKKRTPSKMVKSELPREKKTLRFVVNVGIDTF